MKHFIISCRHCFDEFITSTPADESCTCGKIKVKIHANGKSEILKGAIEDLKFLQCDDDEKEGK